MLRILLTKTKKIVALSISSISILSLIALVYSLVKHGDIIKNIFSFNYLIASIIILYGIFAFFVPINLKKSNRLVDHSNYADVVREEKDKKISDSFESLIWGIVNVIIVGIIEVIVKRFI